MKNFVFVLMGLIISITSINAQLKMASFGVPLDDYELCVKMCVDNTSGESQTKCIEGCASVESSTTSTPLKGFSSNAKNRIMSANKLVLTKKNILNGLPKSFSAKDKKVLAFHIEKSFAGINSNNRKLAEEGLSGFEKNLMFCSRKNKESLEDKVLRCETDCKTAHPNDLKKYGYCWWSCILLGPSSGEPTPIIRQSTKVKAMNFKVGF